MRILALIIVIFCSSLFLIGQETQIKIVLNDKLIVSKTPIEKDSYQSVIERKLMYPIESFEYSKASDSLIYSHLHPFVAALHYSFADHRPVVISPDMIWLLINQSFAIHLKQNPEKYRDQLVDFTGKKTIQITRNDFKKGKLNNPWHEVFLVFSESIKASIGDSLHNVLVPNFSTTGIAEKSAFEISFMDALSSYFDYELLTRCGIPYIVLEGEPADWKWILDNLDFFNSFDLDFWTNRLKPIIEEIYNSSKGDHNIDFWRSIYNYGGMSGLCSTTGWITDFFLYIHEHQMINNKEYTLNTMLLQNRDSIMAAQSKNSFIRGITAYNFPSGLSSVDFTWLHSTDTLQMSFIAGFLGIKQNLNSELVTEISYAIVDTKKDSLDAMSLRGIGIYYPTYCSNRSGQGPTFYIDPIQIDYRKGDALFDDFIREKINENFPLRLKTQYLKTSFLVTKTGDIQDVMVEGLSNQNMIDFIKKLIFDTKTWKPAVIDGEYEDYEYYTRIYLEKHIGLNKNKNEKN